MSFDFIIKICYYIIEKGKYRNNRRRIRNDYCKGCAEMAFWESLLLHYNYIILFVKSKILIRDTEDEGRRLEGRARLGPRSLPSFYNFLQSLTLLPQSFTIYTAVFTVFNNSLTNLLLLLFFFLSLIY